MNTMGKCGPGGRKPGSDKKVTDTKRLPFGKR